MNSELIRLLAFLVGIIAFAALNAAYLVWVERKGAAYFQRRIGPKEVGPCGLLQPLADGLKLMSKQLLVPDGVDPILFKIAPILVLVPAIMSFVAIPFGETVVARQVDLGLLMVFAFASVNVLALLLGGWGSANKYAVIAAARVISQNIAYEIPMLLTAITLVMATNTLNLSEMVTQQAGGFWNWNIIRLSWMANPLTVVSFLIFFVCMVAETNRAPFDMAEAESELIAGVFTEYPGMGFGVFFMGEYANIIIGASITTVMFFGGWQSPLPFIPSGVVWFLLKMYAIIFTVVWIRWTYPRTQFYALLNLSWKVLIPISLFNLILTAGWLKVF